MVRTLGVVSLLICGLAAIQAPAAAPSSAEAICQRDPMLAGQSLAFMVDYARDRLPPGSDVSDDEIVDELRRYRVAQCMDLLAKAPNVGPVLLSYAGKPEWDTAWSSWGATCQGRNKPAACVADETNSWTWLRQDEPALPSKERIKDACSLALPSALSFVEAKRCVVIVGAKSPDTKDVNRCILGSGYHAQKDGAAAGQAILKCLGTK